MDLAAPQRTQPVAEVQDVWKSFGGIPVLKGVGIDVMPGEIHALVGGNGAGKSTLMKIITGVESPDSGQIVIGGTEVKNLNPRQAHANRVYMVPQEPQLFPNLTVTENIFLTLPRGAASRDQIVAAFEQLGHPIDIEMNAGELSISDQQLVEIARGMLREAKLLIVDEPTAALTAHEVTRLFVVLRQLAAQGVGIFYVTHRMSEIFELCGRVTVLRDGAMVLQKPTAETTISEIVTAMVPATESAREAHEAVDVKDVDESVPPLLAVESLTGQGFTDVSFEVRPGEILGVAGVVGSGRTEMAETLFGIRPGTGTVLVEGEPFDKRSPARSFARGLAYVPEDRHLNGVFLLATIYENCTSTVPRKISRGGLILGRLDRRISRTITEQLALQKGALGRKVANLSGGNQQKISLAKSLAPVPRMVILDEPSRGVDVGARADLYRIIRELAARGNGILLISSDFEEVAELSTRCIVMRNGRLTGHLTREHITLASVRDGAFGTVEGANR